eukprot:CAMPEP_0118694990 /NCGR_PEP_ID=MMETSP0800-20121206/12897_1 /TAXON_ID=210618 ORGANISM="Striatella unipunctata, Strain CCMP2910" /NCGR_SAMPLE_ID=MMETSP0800 /ASSEMBLY_ACC=CAM_ASM_000638 /LENGTH=637 /DNA_ID=CAMNT_0006593651 /DNA_START=270 /DNA_END=2183 /DNA_ORIENTATION=-
MDISVSRDVIQPASVVLIFQFCTVLLPMETIFHKVLAVLISSGVVWCSTKLFSLLKFRRRNHYASNCGQLSRSFSLTESCLSLVDLLYSKKDTRSFSCGLDESDDKTKSDSDSISISSQQDSQEDEDEFYDKTSNRTVDHLTQFINTGQKTVWRLSDSTQDSTVGCDSTLEDKSKPSVKVNINPEGAFGLAGEALRRQLDSQSSSLSLSSGKEDRRRFLRSLYAHAGLASNKNNDTDPLVPPLVLATNFNMRACGSWSEKDYFYSRISNPTRHALEQTLAIAEQGMTMDEADENTRCGAACFGSGMASVSALLGSAGSLMSNLEDENEHKLVHAVVPKTCYDEAIKMLRMGAGRIASFTRVDMTSLEAVETALAQYPGRGKVLYMETPDNPLTQICDLTSLVALAKSYNAITLVDTTWSPPLVTQVFRYGIDAICMSCTKTMGGHSDVLCGAVITNGRTRLGKELLPIVKDWQTSHGGVASPFDCWLVLRGLRSFPVRMERMCQTTLALARFLEAHEVVDTVRHPGLESHPQHKLAKKQMDLFGQVFTFCIKGGSEAAMAFVGAVSLARRATSTGGTETLVQHQRSVEMVKVTHGGLIRVSVGLEDTQDLLDDFGRALECSKEVCARSGRKIVEETS